MPHTASKTNARRMASGSGASRSALPRAITAPSPMPRATRCSDAGTSRSIEWGVGSGEWGVGSGSGTASAGAEASQERAARGNHVLAHESLESRALGFVLGDGRVADRAAAIHHAEMRRLRRERVEQRE